jgi:hypothetical protein
MFIRGTFAIVGLILGIGSGLLASAAESPSTGTEFHVAPDGLPSGDGSRMKPWDLGTALAQPPAVKPGDTIWLHDGTYRGGFTSRLKGTEKAAITVRQFPEERAIVDCRIVEGRSPLFVVDGEWTTFWGFEVTCSDPRRVTDKPGYGDIDRGGVHCRGANSRFINMVVHDTGVGFGFWSEGEGGEIYGCLLYNNGWKGPDRGHGHAIYTQNLNGTKRLVDNVMFNQFAYGIHVYGSSRAFLKGFHIEGNACFNNGASTGKDERAPNILVGGGSPAERITLVENYTYHSTPGTSVRLGYGAVNEDLTLKSNYLTGFTLVQHWKKASASGNTFAGANSLVTLDLPEGVEPSAYSWDRNTYLSSEAKYTPLVANRSGKPFASGWEEWRDKLGFDRNSTYVPGPLTGARAFVRPNRYESGRGHVIVYNWQKRNSVEVDLGTVLKPGQKYRVVSVQDPFGEAVAEGAYSGKPVRLPMKPRKTVPPIGMEMSQPPITQPEFDVFLVVPVPS